MHILPSLLVPQTSYPLVGMSSIPSNCFKNWNFRYAILRKLRLSIYNPATLLLCWCGKTHDQYGDHTFCCTENNKKMMHHFIWDGWACALQPTLATTGYIRPNAKLETKKANLSRSCSGLFPLDISFDIDPDPSSVLLHDRPFPTVEGRGRHVHQTPSSSF